MLQESPELRLCTNVIRLQSYRLKPDEVILFDWLVVKAISFKYKPFHYSQLRIEAETRIKRSRQEAIFHFFEELDFLQTSVQVNAATNGRVRFFEISFFILSQTSVLAVIMDEQSELFKHFIQLAKYHSKKQDAPKQVEQKQDKNKQVTERLFAMLDKVYDERREMYNNGKLTPDIPTRTKTKTQLVHNAAIERKLVKLANRYETESICDAFRAYCDAVLVGDEKPERPLHYFLTYDEVQESWTVFERHLDRFTLTYSQG